MQKKINWRFYIITIFLLITLMSVPLYEFIKLCSNGYGKSEYVVPFLGVTSTILLSFFMMPFLAKKGFSKICWLAAVLFLFIELSVEHITAKIDGMTQLMHSRMVYIPGDMPLEFVTIPPIVRIHYYIFSMILILLVLAFVYQLYLLFINETAQKHHIRWAMVLGSIVVLYALVYVFVKVIHYVDYMQLHITLESVLSVAICFIMAATALGVSVGSQIEFIGRKKYIPSAVAFISLVVLYCAEFAMLKGRLYIYGDTILLANLPLIHLSILHLLILFLPAFMVYFILKKISR